MKRKYNNISYIDFGECEAKLKQKHKINYLLILKFDIKLDDNSPTTVEYEVYNPYTKEKLDLSICRNEKINIEIPKILDEYSMILYQNISSFGYDVFNKNDPFYNEICTVYSSEDSTDVLLIDRRLSYYNENLLFCENGCEYSNYNVDRKTASCKCEVKKNTSLDLNIIGFEKNNISGFFDIKTYMNIEIVKFYNLLFCKNGFIKNYGSYILSFGILMFLIVMILFYIKFIIYTILVITFHNTPVNPFYVNVLFVTILIFNIPISIVVNVDIAIDIIAIVVITRHLIVVVATTLVVVLVFCLVIRTGYRLKLHRISL